MTCPKCNNKLENLKECLKCGWKDEADSILQFQEKTDSHTIPPEKLQENELKEESSLSNENKINNEKISPQRDTSKNGKEIETQDLQNADNKVSINFPKEETKIFFEKMFPPNLR